MLTSMWMHWVGFTCLRRRPNHIPHLNLCCWWNILMTHLSQLVTSVCGPGETQYCSRFCSWQNEAGQVIVTSHSPHIAPRRLSCLSTMAIFCGDIRWWFHHKGDHTGTSWGAPWYNKDEVAGQDVYLVAIYRQRHWKIGVSLLPMSRTTICPSCFTTATMEMLIKNLGETTHGFCRSIPRKDDPGCWLPLRVDRGLSYCFRYIQHSYWVVPYIVCTVWGAGGISNLQWALFC